MTDLAGARVTVMGLGRFGGGIGVTRWLAEQGAQVLVTDLEQASSLGDSLAKIQDLVDSERVTLRLGEHNVSDFTTCDVVVANPAVPKPWDNRFLRSAQAAGVPVTTEISLLVERLPRTGARTVAITGSVGKSTTTAMVHQTLCEALPDHTVLLGGNIGGSLLGELPRISDGRGAIVVLELSSAMLYWLDRTAGPALPGERWAPNVAVVTNIASNHIDWHGSFEHYERSKRTLIAHQRPTDTAVLGESVWSWRSSTRARCVRIDPHAFTGELKVPGEHNRVNAAGALAACLAVRPEVGADRFVRALSGFAGLSHRLQLVVEKTLPGRGDAAPVRVYNDSKSTTPDSALKAVEAIALMPGCSRGRIHLIAGGYDKGADLGEIAGLAPMLGGLYTIGATGGGLAERARASLGRRENSEKGRVWACETLAGAVQCALQRLSPGDVLLLSPACASWDQFVNFEQRGDRFCSLVREHLR